MSVFVLSACTIHHVQPYRPAFAPAPETADATAASTNCFEASTVVEHLACTDPALGALNRELAETLATKLRAADAFGRDAVLAAQRGWLLALPGRCPLPSGDAAPPAGAAACLADSFRQQISALSAWQPPAKRAVGDDAIAQYVHFRPAPGWVAPDAAFCAALAGDANAALAQTGTVDPAAMPGAREIAGSHGPDSADWGGRPVRVTLRLANAFGGFAQRASAVSIGAGAPVLDSVSLGGLLQASAANQGARFSAFASQTGDYGAADVFETHGRTVALLSDSWGFYAPAAPGEFAHAGAWDVSTTPRTPLCLFETFQMPAEAAEFDALPSFAAWRYVLQRIRDAAAPALGVSFLRDQGQLRAETNWMLLHMPLVLRQQARLGGWTPWLRLRHDAVLDALFAWSASDPAHKADFEKLFSLLRPAAQDLVRAYQKSEALTGAEATDAAGLAVMEMMYGATVNVAPDLGGDLQAPGSAAGRKPRYPILAAPS